jgi:hypothetical protein
MKQYLRQRIPEKKQPNKRITTKIEPINLLPNYTRTKDDLIIIIPLFNITKSVRIYQNFLYIIQLFEKSNILYSVIELAYFDEPFFTEEKENYFHLRTDSILFHKENLLKIAINNLSTTYKKFCIMDGDIIFDDLNFYDNVSILLDTYDIIQPFKKANWLSINMKDTIFNACSSCYTSINETDDFPHQGFVWAFTLDTFKKIENLFDLIPIGANDTLLSGIICNIPKHLSSARGSLTKICLNYSLEPIKLNYYYLDCTIYHLFHGTLSKRKYSERFTEFRKLINTKEQYIKKNEQGVYEWVEEYKDLLNEYMTSYFKSREDDNV